ncbi:DUF1569 domain-containing protein [Cecembia lonarensis]|uniref:DUF1569 domain-containing protein n=1 Tax=Cecembia lonarensis (strain CCUG 58316 / KCTC 22772 / LW9) TaxID=1225176 RepID=K1L190_CECL9|nr:DUF1569 domain-containing protein [Cecembia lonarensis]EKB48531.1 hypothetical protein B879_02872 [Cecembia lonarensis LW9]
MKKSILNPEELQKIYSRIDQLQSTSQAKWGKMNVSEMMAHCNLANQSIMNAPPAVTAPTFKQRLGKIYFFYLKKEFPKFAKGPKRFDMQGKVDEKTFGEEKSKMQYILKKFEKIEGNMQGMHPRFGPLNHQEWGIFVWKHMDHHLRQFGV